MTNEQETTLILASASPRRRELLHRNGYRFRAVIPAHHEPVTDSLRVMPFQVAEANAYFKARSVADGGRAGLILAADTLVAYGGQVFGKAEDGEQARFILSTLAGTRHQVITGLALIDTKADRRLIRHDTTTVSMRPMPPEVLESYLASGAWEGKAGAYGIQDQGDAFIERIEGSFSNVVGLPLELLARMLAEMGYGHLVQGAETERTRSC